jgi:hypothetical protein
MKKFISITYREFMDGMKEGLTLLIAFAAFCALGLLAGYMLYLALQLITGVKFSA